MSEVTMRSYLKTRKLRIRIIVIICLLLTAGLLVFGSIKGFINFGFLSSAAEVTLIPVKNFFVEIGDSLATLFEDTSSLEAENLRLQNQIEQLETRIAAYSEMEAENARLRALLQFSQSLEYEYVGAQVTAMVPGNWFSSFTINRGETDGVAVGNVVVVGDGLVGKVTQVTPTSAVVTSIVDSTSNIAAMLERTRDNGIVSGTLYLNDANSVLSMDYVADASLLQVGDRVMTSGLDGVYPKGLFVGTVHTISTGSLIIKPAVNFRAMEEVLVLVGEMP